MSVQQTIREYERAAEAEKLAQRRLDDVRSQFGRIAMSDYDAAKAALTLAQEQTLAARRAYNVAQVVATDEPL